MMYLSSKSKEEIKRMAINIAIDYVDWIEANNSSSKYIKTIMGDGNSAFDILKVVKTLIFQQSDRFCDNSEFGNVVEGLNYRGGQCCDITFNKQEMSDKFAELRDRLECDDCVLIHPNYGNITL